MEATKINIALGHKCHKTKNSLRKEKTQISPNNYTAAVVWFKLGLSIYVLAGITSKREIRICKASIKNLEQFELQIQNGSQKHSNITNGGSGDMEVSTETSIPYF